MLTISQISPKRVKYVLLDMLYGQFLKGVTEAGAFLSTDPKVEEEARKFLAKGVIKLIEEDKVGTEHEIEHAMEQAKELGNRCGNEAISNNDGEVSTSIWDSIISFICPFEPFC